MRNRTFANLLPTVALLPSFLLFLSVPAAFGQKGGSASIYGTVTDSTGGVMSGVKVSATNVGTNVSLTNDSDASGNYVFPDLPIGQYRVDAEQTGFGTFEATGISVVVAQNTRINVVLQVGTTRQTVTVVAGAPMVDTESAAAKGTVERQFIDQLPLIDRDVSVLELLQAGTSNNTEFNELSVNGARGGNNEWQMDGMTINNPQYYQMMHNNQPLAVLPSPDAVQEFTMDRTGYEAQYGRTTGAQVLIATRSGTNQYHGLGFDYLRNDMLDSRSFFAANKTPYKRNIFGGTVGGPIRKNKLFFFGSYEGTRTRSSPNSAVQNHVPSQAEINGNFSAIANPIINPATGQPFSGNIIPTGSLSQIAQKVLSVMVPPANGPNGELIFAKAAIVNSDQGIGKIDAILSSKDHLNGSAFIERTNSLTELALPTLYKNVTTPINTVTINETHSFSPTLLNDFTIGGTHDGWAYVPAGSGAAYTTGSFGSTYFVPPINHMIYFNVSGNVLVNNNAPSIRPGQMLQLQDVIHWIRGNHTFVFGYSATRGMTWTTTGNLASGGFTFNGFATGNPIADFMLGTSSSFSQNLTGYIPHSAQDMAAFAQDTWRVRRDFTLNIGLRYVPTWYETMRNGRIDQFLPGEQSTVFPTAPKGIVYEGDAGVDGDNYHRPAYDVFEPRLGIAWTPFGHSSWVVRTAFGVFHQQPLEYDVSNDLVWPYTLNDTINTPPNMVYPYGSLADPFPFTPVSPSASSAVRQALVPPALVGPGEEFAPDFKVPTSLEWNLTIQHRLGNHDGIEVAYVGSHNYRTDVTEDANPPYYIPGQCVPGQYGLTQPGPCSTEANINSRRLWQGIGQAIDDYSEGVDKYDAFQLTYRHEVGKGLTLLANYTLSKTMDASVGADGDESFWNPFAFISNYGLATFDTPQVLNISYAWILPWFASGQGIGGHLVKGWTASGIFRAEGGNPFTIYTDADQSLTGYGSDHADQIGKSYLGGGRSRGQQMAEWFNTQAYELNAVGTYGSLGNTTVRGPGGRYWDMSFFRDFRIGERFKLQYRFDGSNIFNHTVLQEPNSTFGSSGFGVIGGTQNPRILQMALRLVF